MNNPAIRYQIVFCLKGATGCLLSKWACPFDTLEEAETEIAHQKKEDENSPLKFDYFILHIPATA